MRRRSHSLVTLFAFALIIFGCTPSAIAYMCSGTANSKTAEFRPAQYDQVFSGLVISTEHINRPVPVAVVRGEEVVEDPGYWSRTRILVLRVWRGAADGGRGVDSRCH
jgi:hypothetical protein